MFNQKGIILFILIILQANLIEAKDLAIIVNKANPVEDLSLKELSGIFKQERQYWDKEKIHILMREPGSWERETILKKFYRMSDEETEKFWLGKIFRGEITAFPLAFSSETAIKKLVSRLPGAISFIDSYAADDTVKVLKVEGKLPGQEGYLLSGE